ncbi:MAG: hypothetical protein WBA13_14330 [Microcoleaceae cyanobacterium]
MTQKRTPKVDPVNILMQLKRIEVEVSSIAKYLEHLGEDYPFILGIKYAVLFGHDHLKNARIQLEEGLTDEL